MEIIGIIIVAILVNNVVFRSFWEYVRLWVFPKTGYSHRDECSRNFRIDARHVGFVSDSEGILEPFGLEYLQTITFILVIASLVQMVEIIIKKISPPLYQALGVFLPLITTNCVILGVAILVIQKDYNLLESIIYAISTAIGYAMALIIFSSIREQLTLTKIPKAMQGVPIALITAGILAMAFMGFSGIDQVLN